jgi:hypothetical protein
LGKKWETVCVSGLTQDEDHKPKTRKGNQIMKNRNIQFKPTAVFCKNTALLAACLAAVFISGPNLATGAAPEPCEGTVQFTGQSNFQVRQAGNQTFVEFDFTGLHDICLADGSVVTGIVEGHLVQRTAANGDFSLTVDEVLSYNGGTLGYRAEGSLTGGNWHSNVMTVGLGTGPLAGIHGQGTFVFTGPASIADVIYYVYTP